MSLDNIDNQPNEIDLTEIANILLERTQEYCVNYSITQMTLVKNHIDLTNKKLEKTVDSKEIDMLSRSLKTFIDMYNSLQERSVIAFMSQYKPLKNLIDVAATPIESPQQITTEDSIDITDDDIDITDVYQKYED
jgi:hypothetical protein